MKLGFEENIFTYKSGKANKKIRSHLVSERFLLSMIKILSSNLLILRRTLTNMKRFLNVIDRRYYSQDLNLEAMLITCDMLIETRMASNKIIDINIIEFKIDTLLTDQYEDVKDHLIMPTVQLAKTEIPEGELEFISESLDYNLKYGQIIASKDDLVELSNEISTCAYTDFKDVFTKFRGLVTEYYNFFRTTDQASSVNSVVHVNDPSFIDYLTETYESIKNPASALQTGWQGLNSSLGPRGGFLNKNLYLFYANTNSFKSAFLLHLGRMLRTYNTDRLLEISRQTGKIPTILYLEYENDNDEDNERLYKTVVKADIGNCTSPEEMIASWKHKFNRDEDDIVNLSFLHEDSHSMSVMDIDNIIESLSEEGYQVVACIIDYIEMVKPNEEDRLKDVRLQYRGIAESLLNLAKNRNIPVITAHQINRAGGAMLANAKSQGGSNVIANMTNEFIGESYAIEKTASYSAFIDVEDHNGKKYFLFKRNKTRYRRYGKSFFVMEIHDGIIINDDVDDIIPGCFDSIPNTNMNQNLNSETEGTRGVYDIRDRKRTKPNNVINIGDDAKSQEVKTTSGGTTFSDSIEYPDWGKYINIVGLDALTIDGGELDYFAPNKNIFGNNPVTVENSWANKYTWSDTECSPFDNG